MGETDFRLELNLISESPDSQNIEVMEKKIELLKTAYPNKIEVQKTPQPKTFNCYEYALGLHSNKNYMNIKKILTQENFDNIFCNSNFMQCLINKKTILADPDGKLILYRLHWNCTRIVHAAKISDDGSVISKWGTGFIYKHDIYEIPKIYGDNYDRYQEIGSEYALECFKNYLKTLRDIIVDVIS